MTLLVRRPAAGWPLRLFAFAELGVGGPFLSHEREEHTTSINKAIELPNRITLPCVEQGDPSGVPMLLLHGFTDSWHSFEPVLPHLSASIHAFALTQRGHG